MSGAQYYEQPHLWGHSATSGPHATRIAQTILLVPPGAESLGDMGAGDGALTAALRLTRPDVRTLSVERSLAALSHVQGDAVAGSVDRLPLRDRSLSCLAICEVIEHLPVHVYRDTIAELARVAATWILVTVPFAEDRRRSRVTCRTCGCRFNRFQHLRSFDRDDMPGLIPGFRLTRMDEIGPKAVWYPWWLAVTAERLGLLRRAGTPLCPQCGAGEHLAERLAENASGIKRYLPRSRRAMWLAALYERA